MSPTPRALVLYWNPPMMSLRPSIRHHLQAVAAAFGRQTIVLNAWHPVPRRFVERRTDVIVLHTTFLALRWSPRFPEYLERFRWIAPHHAAKFAIPQDEYDHAHVLDDWMCCWNVNDIFTCFGEDARRLLYPRSRLRARFHRVLAGYVAPAIRNRLRNRHKPLKQRPKDIVYRAARLPLYFGRQGRMKYRVAGIVERAARHAGLRCDISTRTQDTIFGNKWFRFLSSSRATLGVESGSGVLDRRGEVRKTLADLKKNRPEAGIAEANELLPAGWDDYGFLTVSPRHFEAAVCKTAQVLVAGAYDGILKPWEHYVPLRPDFSNLSEVIDLIRDGTRMAHIAERAFTDLCLTSRYSYDALTAVVRKACEDRIGHGAPAFRKIRNQGSTCVEKAVAATANSLLPFALPVVLACCGYIRWLLSAGPVRMRRGVGMVFRHWAARAAMRWKALGQSLRRLRWWRGILRPGCGDSEAQDRIGSPANGSVSGMAPGNTVRS